ncbi:hypothetical protein LV84_02493 [Algoriphagus ratkowskyi]|uniref:PLD phosphodiesterase domain-containing protein n=1 Tax=Algoriphagus ratkowskyi TaxID=57028 RepID=A0A2W7RWS7_9BACT|nr:hypothetical protein [Algoriphagus ratkowskyi]PZX55355.1 hypothetical protein LV84_02493 [Algoriphagus ratkowskyi]TXD79714.1 hypothetical protein ESW18_00865 [Algoriphagus ratkowskyi]
MTLLQTLAKTSLKEKGIEGLGLTMPACTPKWIDVADIDPGLTLNEATLTLSGSSENWLAPLPGLFSKTNTSDRPIQFSLQKADGSMINSIGAVIQIFPQVILRLRRLIALKTETENTHTPLRAEGTTVRQVPAFIFIEGTAPTDLISTSIQAGEDSEISGTISFFDEQGFILHPLYVASMLNAILKFYPILSIEGSPENQLQTIIGLQTASKMIRVVEMNGLPYTGDQFEGITVRESSAALFDLDVYTGSDTELQGEIKRKAITTAADGDFPAELANKFLISNVCYGRMLAEVVVPKMSIPETDDPNWIHDFFTFQVMDLRNFLTGSPNIEFNGTKLEPKPYIRLNQNLTLLSDGNSILGHLNELFSDTPDESLLVAPTIDTKIPLPPNSIDSRWPSFPTIPASITPPADDVFFPTNFKSQVQSNSTAQFINHPAAGQPTEVLLTLRGIPSGAAVRVFNRDFDDDATVSRGDGKGGVCITEIVAEDGRTFNGELILKLSDPLGLLRPTGTTTVPTDPELIFDMMIIRQNPKTKRLFGALTIPITAPNVVDPTAPADNSFESVAKKGVCNSAILGLKNSFSGDFDFSDSTSTLNTILSFMGETNPRDAPRQPTMARREVLYATKKNDVWKGGISGGLLNASFHHAQQDLGSPGSPGGAENTVTGIQTSGQLAYDLARMAFRRTTSFYERFLPIRDDLWEQPDNPTALAASDSPTVSAGIFAGALLQTVSPNCETPELSISKIFLEDRIDDIPKNLDELIDLLVEFIDNLNLDLSGMPEPVGGALGNIETELKNLLNGLKDGDPLSESQNERFYNEVLRELSASIYGRRDSQWALEQAIGQARKSIYIESPGFNFTEGETPANYTVNLLAKLSARLAECPGLKLIICIPKHPDYSFAYNQWEKSEVKERYDYLQAVSGRQMVVFHPIGFPGRPSNISTQTVLIDDNWGMVGSGSFRRRGLTFDGSNDLVFTAFDRVHGKVNELKEFRKSILAQRIGVDLSNADDSRNQLLQDFGATFQLIREMLVVGGLGKIDRLWNGRTANIPYVEPTIHKDLANPEGLEFNALSASIFNMFSTLET